MTNLLDEPLMLVSYKFESPKGINVSATPPNYIDIMPNSTNPMYLYITPSETMENGTYTIKVWAESEEKVGKKNIMSEKYPIYVNVLINPDIPTTTTTITTTTATTTTTLLEQKIRQVLLREENLGIVIIVILLAIIGIPYLSFKGSSEEPSKLKKDKIQPKKNEINNHDKENKSDDLDTNAE